MISACFNGSSASSILPITLSHLSILAKRGRIRLNSASSIELAATVFARFFKAAGKYSSLLVSAKRINLRNARSPANFSESKLHHAFHCPNPSGSTRIRQSLSKTQSRKATDNSSSSAESTPDLKAAGDFPFCIRRLKSLEFNFAPRKRAECVTRNSFTKSSGPLA